MGKFGHFAGRFCQLGRGTHAASMNHVNDPCHVSSRKSPAFIVAEHLKIGQNSMVVSGSPKRWDRWHSPSPNWQEKNHLYTTYSPCLLGGYMLPTTC